MPPHRRHRTYSTIINGYEVTAVQQSYGLRTIRTNPVPRDPPSTEGLRVIHLTPSMWEFVVEKLSIAAVSQAQTTTTVQAIAEVCALSQQDVQTILDAVLQSNEATKLLQLVLKSGAGSEDTRRRIEAFLEAHPFA